MFLLNTIKFLKFRVQHVFDCFSLPFDCQTITETYFLFLLLLGNWFSYFLEIIAVCLFRKIYCPFCTCTFALSVFVLCCFFSWIWMMKSWLIFQKCFLFCKKSHFSFRVYFNDFGRGFWSYAAIFMFRTSLFDFIFL